jgi:hypothetical protein
MTPTLQIIIRVENPERGVNPLVSYLYDQRHPGMDVTVVYQDPPVDLQAVQSAYPITTLALAPGNRPGAAINQAAQRSDSDYLVIVSNSRLPRDGQWLFHLLKHFSDSRVAAVSGEGWDPEQVSAQRPSYQQDLANFLSAPQFGLSLTNLAVRRDLWNLHAFDERLAICVDRQWAYRVLCEGYQVVLDYAGRMHDVAPLSEEEAFKRYWAMNLSFSQFIQPEQAHKSLWSLAMERAWQLRNPAELLRAYRAWGILRKLNFWQATPTQAMAARATFSRPGDKWAV